MATRPAIDRLVHHSTILEFDVESYRTNGAKRRKTEGEMMNTVTETVPSGSSSCRWPKGIVDADHALRDGETAWSSWPPVVFGIILLAGAVLRLRAFSFDGSLWGDELAAAISLLHLPHDPVLGDWVANQPSPYGFRVITEFVLAVFGVSEKSLRLFPFVASIVSLPLFGWLAVRWGGIRTALLPMFIFATNPFLVRYASEFKTYSLDVCVTCAILALAVAGRESSGARRALLPVGALAVWFSFPSIFVLAAVATVEGATAATSQDRALRVASLRRILVWGLSFLASFVLVVRGAAMSPWLLQYWRELPALPVFWPLFPPSLESLRWPFECLTLLFVDPGGMRWGAIVGSELFLLGSVALLRRRPPLATLLVVPLGLAMIASSVERYPVHGRLMLFYVPLLALGLGEGARWAMGFSERVIIRSAVAVAILAALAGPVTSSVSGFIRPEAISDSRPILEHIATRLETGDVLYVFRYALPVLAFYGPRMGLGDVPVISAPSRDPDSEPLAKSLDRIPPGARVWFLMAGISISGDDFHGEEVEILAELDKRGRRLAVFRATEAVVYLFQQ